MQILILRQAVIKEKALKRRRRKLIKRLIKHKYLKHRDGRQLYELTNKELYILIKEQEVSRNT